MLYYGVCVVGWGGVYGYVVLDGVEGRGVLWSWLLFGLVCEGYVVYDVGCGVYVVLWLAGGVCVYDWRVFGLIWGLFVDFMMEKKWVDL